MSSNIVTDVEAGGEFSIFVTENRKNSETELFGTGFNLFGELGIGSSKHVQDMEKIDALSNFKMQDDKGKEHHLRVNQIECGSNHCMVLFNLGAALAWGANEFGQLGKFRFLKKMLIFEGNKKRTFSTKPIIYSNF